MLAFEEYRGPDGERPVTEWIEDLSPDDYQLARKFMRIARAIDWKDRNGWFKKYHTKKDEPALYEARWPGMQRVPHRIFCYPDGRTPEQVLIVVFLCGFTHKDQRMYPSGAQGTASRYYREIENGGETDEFTLGQAKGA